MLRRNLLKSLSVLPFLSVLKLQENKEEKPFRTVINEYADGVWNKRTYSQNNNQLTFEDSEGNWSKWTYDHNGNLLIYESSTGVFAEYRVDHLL
jgi:tRNA U34 5-methylaminomethyl-2-thiouridine-forming methyltransferase MnmC